MSSRSHSVSHNSPGSVSLSDEARAFRKLRRHVQARGANGVPVLAPSYVMLEKEVSRHPEAYHIGLWDLKRLLRKAELQSMSESEIDSWVRTRATGEPGNEVVDAVALLVDLRLELHCTQQQIDDIIRKLRANKNSTGLTPMQRLDSVLTKSEKLFVLHYLENDMDYLSDLLADQIPVDIVYPCLLNKLIDAVIVVDNGKSYTGTIGVWKCTKYASRLEHASFKRCMKEFQCGLGDGEIDILFNFVATPAPPGEGPEPLVSVPSFLNIVRQKLDSVAFCQGDDNIQRIIEKIQYLMQKTSTTFPLLTFHNEIQPLLTQSIQLAGEESDFPIMLRYAEILRAYGILTAQVPDIDLELLWCYMVSSQQGVADVLSSGAMSAVREDAVDHAYNLLEGLCSSQQQPLTAQYLLHNFRVSPRYSCNFMTQFQTFIHICGVRDVVPRDTFLAFWRCVSFNCEADSEFNMLLWNSHQLSGSKVRKSI